MTVSKGKILKFFFNLFNSLETIGVHFSKKSDFRAGYDSNPVDQANHT